MRYLFLGIIFFAMACSGPPSQVEVVTPKSVVTRVADDNDSTIFSITILEKSFDVKVRDKAAILKNEKELNEFIELNKSLIDPARIKLISDRNAPYERFKSVIEVMKKHEYYKFSMITK